MSHRSSYFDAFIRFHSKFTWITWVCLSLATPGVICLAVSARMIWIEWQYHTSARETHGTVLSKLRSRSSGSFGGTGSSRGFSTVGGVFYTVRYEYRTPSTGASEDSDDVSESYWDKHQPGDSLKVYYLPEHASHSRLSLGIRPFPPLILFLVGVPTTFAGVGGAFAVVSDRRRKYRKKHPLSSQGGPPRLKGATGP